MICRCETGRDGKYILYYIMTETRNYWYSHLTSFKSRGCRQHVHHLRLGKPKSSICICSLEVHSALLAYCAASVYFATSGLRRRL